MAFFVFRLRLQLIVTGGGIGLEPIATDDASLFRYTDGLSELASSPSACS